jgi:DNA-directed RNA polymerase subunit RPC12/RpoP
LQKIKDSSPKEQEMQTRTELFNEAKMDEHIAKVADLQGTNVPKCPYCGAKDYPGQKIAWEKKIKFNFDLSQYESDKSEYVDCKKCGREFVTTLTVTFDNDYLRTEE